MRYLAHTSVAACALLGATAFAQEPANDDAWRGVEAALPAVTRLPALALDLPLTEREREVLRWVGGGKTDRDIADILAISPRTVHKHLQRVYAKLGVETRTAAVMRALRLAA